MRRAIAPARAPASADGKVRIHIGCGDTELPGFWNIDARPLRHVHYVQSACPLDMFDDESADLIYASHVLEHFSLQGAEQALAEWHRVLRPEGVLRLAVPDYGVLAEIYAQTGDIRRIRGALMGGQNYPGNFHQSVYDERLLGDLLRSVGFEEVRRWDPWDVHGGSPPDTSAETRPLDGEDMLISLNLEAIKGTDSHKESEGCPQAQSQDDGHDGHSSRGGHSTDARTHS
ncbi:MAG: class I SAM-dependent methyltransferase [Phycisphaerae bacterium]